MSIRMKVVLFILGIWSVGVMIVALPIIYGRLQPPEKRLRTIMSSHTDCSVPCWQGITPGISTTADVEALIMELEESKNLLTFTRYLFISNNPRRHGRYSWEDWPNDRGVSIQVSENSVESIRFDVPGARNSESQTTTFEMVTDYLGIPDAYVAAYTPNVHYPRVLYHIYLYYPQYGTKVTLTFHEADPNYSDCRFIMAPDTHVWSITFSEPVSTGKEMRDRELKEGWPFEPMKPWDNSGEIELSPCRPLGM